MSRRQTSLPESASQPAMVRGVNGILSLLGATGERSLSVERLLEEAAASSGLSDFGPGDITTPLSVLIDSIHSEAQLHPLGYLIARTRLLGLLRNRLRSSYWFDRHPEILEQSIDQPIVITGLQRTGTTLLQRLFAADPDFRSLASWEGLNPAPLPPSRSALKGDPRRCYALRAATALRLLAPEFYIIHPVEHDGPEEEVLLLDGSFISTVPEALMYVPSYATWVENQDQSPSYDRLVAMLKLLQWQERRPYWVLKSPHHLEWSDYLLSYLPDTKLIMTHRDPVVATSSFFSMVWHSNRLLSSATTPESLARHWLRKTRRMMDRFLDHRDRLESTGSATVIVDVLYDELVADPVGTMGRLYEELGLSYTAEKERRIRESVARHRRDRYGVHRYRLESFGISLREAEEAFGAYRERFALSTEEG